MKTRLVLTLMLATALPLAASGSSPAQTVSGTYPRAIVYGTEGGGAWLSSQNVEGPLSQFLAYFDFTVGGLHVAAGDVDDDGKAEIVTGPGWASRGELRVFDSRGVRKAPTVLAQPFGPGVRVAAGDVNGDGKADLIAGNDRGGGPNVQVFDAVTGRRVSFFGVFQDPRGSHGIRVGAGDVNGDGRAEVITGDDVDDGRVNVFTASASSFFPSPLRSFTPFGTALVGGLQVATGDFNQDARAEIIVAGETVDGPRVKVFDGATGGQLRDLLPFEDVAFDSLRVAAGDVNGDDRIDIVAAADTGAGPMIRAFSYDGEPLFSLPGITAKESVAAGDVDGDGKAEIIVSTGPAFEPRVVVLDRGSVRSSFSAYEPFLNRGVRVAVADLDGDGDVELVSGQGPGNRSAVDVFDTEGGLVRELLPFAGAAKDGVYVAAGDLNGDRKADVVVGADSGGAPWVKSFDGAGVQVGSFLAFEPSFTGGVRVAAGDTDGDGKAEIVAGSGPGAPPLVHVFDAAGHVRTSITPFSPFFAGGVFVAAGDLGGDGRAEIVVGAGPGTAPYVRVFDAQGEQLEMFLAYEESFRGGVRVAVGDPDRDGKAEIVTGTGPGRQTEIRRFSINGTRLATRSVHSGFDGGIYVALQSAVGPSLSLGATDRITHEGELVEYTVATFTDPGASSELPHDFNATISWGDGTKTKGVVWAHTRAHYGVTAAKAYSRYGQYPITVRITDRFLRIAVARATATVFNVPLSAHGGVLRVATGREFRETVAILIDRNRLSRRNDFRATIRWGDGATSTGQLVKLAPGRFAVKGQHTYPQAGRYVVRVRIRDVGGMEASARTIVVARSR